MEGNSSFSVSYHHPGGMQMPGRATGLGDYRYAYNGMETDGEVSGNGNSYTTEFRQYDPRLMRWKSLDPLMQMFPSMSPYVAFDNNPIYYTDPLGLASKGGGKERRAQRRANRKEGWTNGGESQQIDEMRVSHKLTSKERLAQKRNRQRQEVPETTKSDRYDNVDYNFETLDDIGSKAEAREREIQRTIDRHHNNTTIDNGYSEAQKLATINGEIYDPLFSFIPGRDIVDKMLSGEDLTGWDFAIEGIGVIPGGKLITNGGKLFARTSKGAVEVTNRVIKVACFIEGTKVSIEDGFKNIEDIEIGDLVWSFNENTNEISLKYVINTVVKEIDHLDKLIIESDTIYTTDDHPFWVSNSWKNASDLNVGDTLTYRNGQQKVLSYKERIDTTVTVYNFAVEEFHTYFVGENGVLVHNNNPCATVIKKQTSGWVVRKVFNTLDPAIQRKITAAIKNGIVSPKGQQGIIKLTATEAKATGYSYKVKILGKGGDLRIYGNMNESGHIVFDKVMGH
jgi:RHS repeat-associated protein